MFWFFCFSIKDPISLKLIECFCCYSASTMTIFGFCSCWELLQLKFGKKKVAGKCKLLSPQDRLFYDFLKCILGVKLAQSKGKIVKLEAFRRTQTNNFAQFCTVLRLRLMRKLSVPLNCILYVILLVPLLMHCMHSVTLMVEYSSVNKILGKPDIR